MSEDKSQTTNTQQNAGQDKEAADLAHELREMGQQLEAAFRAAVESERVKQLQRDLAGGVHELSTQIQAALKSVQSTPRFQQVEDRGRQAINQAKHSKIVQDVQETIVSGIAQLNDKLRQLVERLEAERNVQPEGPTTQRIDVEQDEPATSQTSRLDDNDQTRL